MEIITDLRKLKSINKKIGNVLVFDKKYKYILEPTYYSLKLDNKLEKLGYEIQFIDGCFFPYLIKINKKGSGLDDN